MVSTWPWRGRAEAAEEAIVSKREQRTKLRWEEGRSGATSGGGEGVG